jgi:hypothetical protein
MEEFGATIGSSEKEKSFDTRYTIGSSPSDFKPGDEIFALDGVPCPLLLRQVRPNRYRIVGKCYILFGDHLRICNAGPTFNTQCDQTRMIEVY